MELVRVGAAAATATVGRSAFNGSEGLLRLTRGTRPLDIASNLLPPFLPPPSSLLYRSTRHSDPHGAFVECRTERSCEELMSVDFT
jgi:hypothetical protein